MWDEDGNMRSKGKGLGMRMEVDVGRGQEVERIKMEAGKGCGGDIIQEMER